MCMGDYGLLLKLGEVNLCKAFLINNNGINDI